jgi:hypothetical protein
MLLKPLAMIASATALMFGLAAGAPSPLSAAPMGVTGHSWDAIASANAGMDGIEHIWSVGYTSITDLKKRHQADAIRKPGMYLVTVKSRSEPVAQSNPAPFVVSFKDANARPPVTTP